MAMSNKSNLQRTKFAYFSGEGGKGRERGNGEKS